MDLGDREKGIRYGSCEQIVGARRGQDITLARGAYRTSYALGALLG
jgi:hypothetical protein